MHQAVIVGEGTNKKRGNVGVKLCYSSVQERGRSPIVSDNTTTVHITSECVTNLSVQLLTPELASVRQRYIKQRKKENMKE